VEHEASGERIVRRDKHVRTEDKSSQVESDTRVPVSFYRWSRDTHGTHKSPGSPASSGPSFLYTDDKEERGRLGHFLGHQAKTPDHGVLQRCAAGIICATRTRLLVLFIAFWKIAVGLGSGVVGRGGPN
jgi:hypothetical protein